MSATINNVFEYCDLLEHVIVRNTKTPLLCIVIWKINVVQAYVSMEHVTFNPMQYVPLLKKYFETVIVQLMTDIG